MATPVLLPKQGNSVETCNIIEWRKNPGDPVKQGDVLCEVESDKAVFEVESPVDGVLLTVYFQKGEDVPVLTNIALVGEASEQPGTVVPVREVDESERQVNHQEVESATASPTTPGTSEKDRREAISPGIDGAVRGISPRAKALMEKLAISPEKITGTGPGNRILERDILAASGKMGGIEGVHTDQSAAESEEDVRIVPLKGIRKIVATRMLESVRNSAQLTLNCSADASALLSLRKRFKEGPPADAYSTVTINDLVHFAVVQTLPEFPDLNSLMIDETIEYHKRIDLGFAVDTSRGLIVPVIRDSQAKTLLELSVEAKRLAAAAHSGKISPEELNGATFTVTNLGGLGIESFTPILNLPQTAILGVNAISPKAIDRGDGIDFVPHITFSLTVDHRVIDGAFAARFLQGLSARIAEIDQAIGQDTKRK